MDFNYQKVKLVAMSKPEVDGILSPEEFIGYVARVSNPTNQTNNDTAPKLLKYLQVNKHWSPFEMVNVCLEIITTRDIGRQILRHRSFHFQEFSQRYAALGEDDFGIREPRLQDLKNRQNSVDMTEADEELQKRFIDGQKAVQELAVKEYLNALKMGIAKEQARVMLPEGMALSRMYMNGTLRDWIHYIIVRTDISTQKEHRDIAIKAREIIIKKFPSLETTLVLT